MGTKNWTPEPAPERFGQVPLARGVVFICRHCGRPTATKRDACLKAWGERGIIREVAGKLRCTNCRKRGMDVAITPGWAGLDFGSATDLQKLLAAIANVKPIGEVR